MPAEFGWKLAGYISAWIWTGLACAAAWLFGRGGSCKRRKVECRNQETQTDWDLKCRPTSIIYVAQSGDKYHTTEACYGLRNSRVISSRSLCKFCGRADPDAALRMRA